MSDFIDVRLEPALWLLGDWSLRWDLLVASLATDDDEAFARSADELPDSPAHQPLPLRCRRRPP
jgi:hypothetical protein